MFEFKLQSVLEYRVNLEEKSLGLYSDAQRKLEDEKDKLRHLTVEREDMLGQLRGTGNQVMRPEEIASMVSYIETLRTQELEQKNVIHQAKETVDAKRKELIEAVKNRKVLEKLKDTQAEAYNKNTSEREQKHLDEMAVLKFGRREL